jgi:hypothetical protein
MKTAIKTLSFAKLEAEADRLFSLLVRQKAANEIGLAKCCTCGAIHHWRRLQNGHFISRGNKSTRFDEKNTGAQCVSCNIFSQGRQFEFAQYLDKKYGAGISEAMLFKSKMITKRNAFDLKYMIAEFKAELKRKGYELR